MMNVKSIELRSRSIDDIRIFMIELIDYYNTVEGTNIPFIMFPISINKRLSRVLGRFNFSIINGTTIKPNYIQFSNIIMQEDDETLIETLKHEVAHYIATMRYQKNCEHNEEWQEVCRILGMKNISPYTKTTNKFSHRYLVICENCGILGVRDRLNENFRTNIMLGFSECGKCCNDRLVIYDTRNKTFVVGEGNEKIMQFIK